MSSSSLEVPRRQPTEKRSKLWRILVILATIGVAVGWAVWFVRTPDDLPTTTDRVDDAGVVGQETYVGMFAVGDGFDRTLDISEITVDVTADGEVEVVPKLCRGGSLNVTTDADTYCPDFVDAEGEEFTGGDSIVLVVSASEPTEVEIGQLEISFREGIKWGSNKPAGIEGATLDFVESTPGTVEEDTEPEDSTTERPGADDEENDKKDRKKREREKDRQGDREGRDA